MNTMHRPEMNAKRPVATTAPVPQELAVRDASPYPELSACTSNNRYMPMLTQDFVATHSEFTTISMYLYQSWMLQEQYPELSKTIKRIAQVEMQHLDILGQLIVHTGGTPKYRAVYRDGYTVWNGTMVHYGVQIHDLLRRNIRGEQEACERYTLQAQKVQDPGLCAVFSRLALDEKLHAEIFQEAFNSLPPT